MKKVSIGVSLSIVLSFASSSMPPMPPMPPVIKSTPAKKDVKSKKPQLPKECELLPPMVIFLPPPMEAQLDKCKNEIYKPKIEFAQKQLSKLLKKSVKVKSVTVVKKFSKLYKIVYDGGTVLCNEKVDACIKR